MGSFVIEKGATGAFHFNLQADNNEIVLTSQHYASKQKAEEGIASVKANAGTPERFKHHTSKVGKPYFTLVAANGETIGTSEMYASKQKAEEGCAAVAKLAASAKTVDHA